MEAEMKKITLCLLAAALFLSLNLVLPCPQLQAKTYKIATTHWIGFSPLNVADVKGFWKEQGLDVQIVNNVDVQLIAKQVETKEVDIGMNMMGTWTGLYMDNVPIKIIAETDWSSGGDKIIAKKDLVVSQLKGKPIGTYDTTPAVTFFLNKYLAENGLKLSDVKLVQFDPENLADNFISGRFNLIVNFDPQALRAEKSGQGKVVATSATYSGCIPEGMAMHSDVLKETPKEDLVKILRGWFKAVTWCQDGANWKEYVQILNTKTFEGEAPYSEEDIKGMMGAVKLHDPQASAERNKADGGLFNYLKELKGFLSENGMLKKDYAPEDLFDNAAVVEAVQGG
jgi:NitT/TauT family transport system substrate-binding protein